MSAYTLGEIVVWLVLAALLGFALGWLLRELKYRGEQSASAATPVSAGGATPIVPRSPVVPSAEASAEKAPAKKAATKTVAATTTAAVEKTAAKKAPAKKSPAKKAPAKKSAAKKAPAKKAPTKKTAAKNAPTKESPTKKTAAKKTAAKKTAAKKTPATKAAAVTPGRFPGSARPLSGGRAPSADYTIKGNEDSMIYHSPDSPSYSRTVAETWFRTEADAVAAGFRKPRTG